MRKLRTLKFACAAIMALFFASTASAFNASNYATTSKLASGKWVKISIPEDGIYELTYSELTAMGFNNPANVRLYGQGGYRISEVLNGSAADDLVAVPVLRTNNKICFYGKGPVGFSLSDLSTTPHYTRVFNPYSQVGCYFLTEESGTETTPGQASTVSTTTNFTNIATSMSYYWHENELISVGGTGKDMLGEDFSTHKLYFDYYLPQIADSTIVVHSTIAANASEISYAGACIHSGSATDTTAYSISSSRIYKPSSSYVFYNYASPFGNVKLSNPAETGQYEPTLTFTSEGYTINFARLDYFILTYRRNNIINDDENGQMFMGFASIKGNERVQLPNASSSIVVWNIANRQNPKVVSTETYNDETGTGTCFFTPSTSNAAFIAFDPLKTLKKITSYENVANQNLHALTTPNLLIITDSAYVQEAQRLADMHTAIDGITCAIVPQHQIFNEFSSGTRDAMAYRLLAKMLYDRDNTALQNILLFGTGTIDNREINGKHPGNLLTYQSDNSNYEDFSFTSDDFFAFLTDNSGNNVSNDKLTIGIGRITCADVEEAASDVDKIVEYYGSPNYGVWRNNTFVSSDSPDAGMFIFQAQGYEDIIDSKVNMHVNSVHNSMYPRSTSESSLSVDRRTATTGKRHWSDLLKGGTYFATYVGHAGSICFTKHSSMWTNGDVARTNYDRFPIMSTACCDVAHFDSDTRGIAESMFHKRDGGAIALLTSSRMVFATGNDQLNTYFINSLFDFKNTGVMPTLGDAYKAAKLGFTSANTNKMSFFLLGDPAMRVNYPRTLFNILKVNGTDVTDTTQMAELSPLMEFEIQAQVVNADGELDNTFNGDVTATLYDKQEPFTSLTFSVNGVNTTRDIYFEREKLAEIQGRAENGVFKGNMIVPKNPLANGDEVLLRVYAHKDNSDIMVNGSTKRITMKAYDESVAINDNTAPVINTMFINDENTFTNGSMVGTTAVAYLTASDDYALCVQPNATNYRMTLTLDGGKISYGDVTSFVTMTDGSKAISIEYPLYNLAEGLHTLTYTVYDLLGNSASRTITFMVGQDNNSNVVADKMPAFVNGDVNFDFDTDMNTSPEVVVRVTDATGKLVWKTTATSFPVTWNMKDMNGQAVPAGLYRYFGTYNDGTNYGGTAINKLVVLEELKSNK